MPNVDERIHFYYDGHTYEIEPASLNHDDAWFNATQLAHGASETGEVLSQMYDSTYLDIDWENWSLIKTADEANDDGTITYWYVGVTETNVVDNTTTNADGSETRIYTSTKTYPDGTTVSYAYVSTLFDDGSGNTSETEVFPDGTQVRTTTVLTLEADDTISEETTTTTTLAGGATINYPSSGASTKLGGGVTTSSVANNIYSYLANVGSAAENEAIYKHAKTIQRLAPTVDDGGNGKFLWLGGTDDSSNNWYWVGLTNTEDMTYTSLLGEYDNWDGAEPDNPGVQGGMAIGLDDWYISGGSRGTAGEWASLDQDGLLYSVIEWNGLIGTAGKDKLTGSGDDCVVHAGAEKDMIKTFSGNDVIYGQEGDDKIYAGGGNDLIMGGSGIDYIDAGSGNDIIIAGDGGEKSEKIRGGTGNDLFVLTSLEKTVPDIIMDFDANRDKIVLDSSIFSAFEDPEAEEGDLGYFQVEANQFLKGLGVSQASNNETGVDDYLIYDMRGGKLYYDADGNGTESSAVLILVVKGNTDSFDFGNFVVI